MTSTSAFGYETVSVIGLGYIGLPTAAILSSRGVNVIGVDINDHIVRTINAACAHFTEPDLDGLVHAAVTSGRLTAYHEPRPADAFIIAVPTPVRADKAPDMSFVDSAASSVARVLKRGDLLILESTSPVGTTDRIAGLIREQRPDLVRAGTSGELDISIAYCPERILPGRIVAELVENDRIVGGIGPQDAARARALYGSFVRGAIFETSAAIAEMVKLVENAYRDVNIAFANEVANVSERFGMNPWEVISLANKHPRVNILNPGPGVGGHCIAVDPWFLIAQNPEITPLMRAARLVNDGRPGGVIAKVERAAAKRDSRRVACLGLAYKSDVDDLRESPSVEIAVRLATEGFDVAVVEPNIGTLPAALARCPNIRLTSADEAIEQSDVVALLVGHRAFHDIDPESLAGKDVIDCVGIWTRRTGS